MNSVDFNKAHRDAQQSVFPIWALVVEKRVREKDKAVRMITMTMKRPSN